MRVHAAIVVLAALLLPRPVAAQCSANASSCVACHETQALRPVLQGPQPWHRDHAFGDLCVACHAGDPNTAAKEAAHRGLRQPLLEASSACAGCHAADGDARAARYAAAMFSTPTGPGERAAQRGALADIIFGSAAVVLAIPIYMTVRRGSRQGGRSQRLRAESRRAYLAGGALGCVVAFSELVYARPLAVSGAFDKLAAYLGRRLFPASQYYGQVMMPGITWHVWVVLGILVGSFASALASGQARWRWLPDTQWSERFGRSRQRRLWIAFSGAALVQIGAGIAGGCTSGLAISGGAALAPGAFVFMAGMFAGGIPTAWFLYRGES